MNNGKISRREFAGVGASVFAATTLAAVPGNSRAQEAGGEAVFAEDSLLAAGVAKAFTFLHSMMDAYAQGQTLRLIQSYSDQDRKSVV